jgi:hypothetical protein
LCISALRMNRRAVARPFAGLLLVSAVIGSACGSTAETSVNVTGPSEVRCQPTLQSQPTSFGPTGGTGTVTVSVSRECPWTANASAPWIALTAGRQGQGDGTVSYRVAENADPVTRRGAITISDQTVQVAQEPAPCRFSVSAGETAAPAAGGELTVQVRTHSACGWTASTNSAWASPTPTTGTGDATVRVHVSANGGPRRTAELTIAGQRITVVQGEQSGPAPPTPPPPPGPSPPPPAPPAPPPPAPGPCGYVIDESAASFGPEGGQGMVRLRTGALCPWTALSPANWVVVSGPVVGTGDAEIRYTVAPNFTTSSRTTTIVIGTATHRISQSKAEEIRFDGKIGGLSGSCPNLRFTVDGRTVITDRETEFRDGRCSDAQNGEDVEVRGFPQSDGTVLARRVEFDD